MVEVQIFDDEIIFISGVSSTEVPSVDDELLYMDKFSVTSLQFSIEWSVAGVEVFSMLRFLTLDVLKYFSVSLFGANGQIPGCSKAELAVLTLAISL